jgi:hypothetical protein
MKNLYLLQTDKPSRLYFDTDLQSYELSKEVGENNSCSKNQYLYITKDEEIKEGDWCIDKHNVVYKQETDKIFTKFNGVKKIILTTDSDLIADGVQSIDDEFLEWFIKNPNCEEVEIHNLRIKNQETGEILHYRYEIDTPKEEKWDKLNKEFDSALDSEFGSEKFKHPKVFSENGNELFFDEEGKLIKEETLDEGAEKYAEGKSSNSTFRNTHIRDFKAGADWQSKTMYNEVDMKQFAFECVANFLSNNDNEVEMELVDVITNRIDIGFEQFLIKESKKH